MTNQPDTTQQQPHPQPFISWRWRITTPLVITLIALSMLGAYSLVDALGRNIVINEENTLLLNTESITQRTATLFEQLRSEARRIAFTVGVPQAVLADEVASLQPNLQTLATVANLDALIITDAMSIEKIGLLRVTNPNAPDTYSLATGTDLTHEALIALMQTADAPATATLMLRSAQGILIVVAQPIITEQTVIGAVIVGQFLDNFLIDLRASAHAHISLYDTGGTLLQTTFDLTQTSVADLSLNPDWLDQTLTQNQRLLIPFTIADTSYRQTLQPFQFGGRTLGMMSVAQPNNVPFATFSGQQTIALFASILTGAVVFVVLGGVSVMAGQVETVTETVTALTRGETTRTAMQPTDEITTLGHAIDQYADTVAEREDKLRNLLRRQRRERNYLLAVMESMPDGVIVQDEDARIIVMNTTARELLSGHPTPQNQTDFKALIAQQLGETIAPGLYALGDPLTIQQEGKMLTAQAGAVLSSTGKQLGTVILLRDITDIVRQAQARDDLLDQLAADVQQPLARLAHQHTQPPLVHQFAHHISQHAATLQKMIVDMRELTHYSRLTARPHQRPIATETLIWAVANDWRQIAQAADLTLQVDIRKTGLFILGDESRLRYALGNIVDNALKYTPPGGIISIEVKDEIDNAVHLRVRDSGVGISPQDYPHLFTPFYRGTPITRDGQIIRVPGMGQGLAQARQIVVAHGGIMRVKTRLHIGSAVYIALPLTSGISYHLPTLADDTLEGDTVIIPDNVDIEAYWRNKQ